MAERPRVFTAIVTSNGMEFLPELFASLGAQTGVTLQIQAIDNGSNDGAERFVRARYPQATFLRNVRNLGVSAARNQAVRLAFAAWSPEERASRYVLCVDPDVMLTQGCVEALVAEADAHPDTAAVCGKILRAFREPGSEDPVTDLVRSDVIDSLGMSTDRFRCVHPRAAGAMDQGQWDQSCAVFAPPPSLVLYRASALEDIRDGDWFFDPDIGPAAADADLAWRLRLRGWDVRVTPKAMAYRFRPSITATQKEPFGFPKTASAARAAASDRVLMAWKNEPFLNALLSWPWRCPYAVARFCYALLLRPSAFGGWLNAWSKLPARLKHRRFVQKGKKVTAKEARKWFA